MADRRRQDTVPGAPHDDTQAHVETRPHVDTRLRDDSAAQGNAPAHREADGAGETSFLEDYINFNTKIVQNYLDSFSLGGFYLMLDGLFGMMGGGQHPASSLRGAGAAAGREAGTRPAMNLGEIENALTQLMAASEGPDAEGFADKEALSADIIRRVMSGYTYVNQLLHDGVDLFSYGSSHHWLELNHLVLCGATPERREQFSHHIAETERRFYNDSLGGIGERMDWLQRHRHREPVAVAAGIFLHITSSPQLFIEGNSRTATLIASYALVSHGLPPLVVGEREYRAFFELTAGCKHVERQRWDQALSFRRESSRIEQFLRAAADPRYLARSAK